MRAAYDDVARRQLGLVTTTQLAERKWTYSQIRTAIANGEFFPYPARRGVLRCAGIAESQDLAWMAARVAAGDDHMLGALTASAVWGFKSYPDPPNIELLTASTSRTRMEGVTTHRTLWLPKSHTTTRRKLSVTTPERTLYDTATLVPFKTLRTAANDAIRRDLLRERDLTRLVDRMPRTSGAVSAMRMLAAVIVPGYHPGESEPELDIAEMLVAGGYEPPEHQIWVRGDGWRYRIDVGYRELKQGFEYQSEQEHLNRESFHRDQLRTTRLQRAGWTVWPITSRTSRTELLAIAEAIFGHEARLSRTS